MGWLIVYGVYNGLVGILIFFWGFCFSISVWASDILDVGYFGVVCDFVFGLGDMVVGSSLGYFVYGRYR